MNISKTLELKDITFMAVKGGFEVYTSDSYDIFFITFDQLEQFYTWAASVHEGENDNG